MAEKIGNVVAKVGSYLTRDGEEKAVWRTCGTAFRNDRNEVSFKLDTIPAGGVAFDVDGHLTNGWDGWFKVFPDEEKEGQRGGPRAGPRAGTPRAPTRAAAPDFDDPVPF